MLSFLAPLKSQRARGIFLVLTDFGLVFCLGLYFYWDLFASFLFYFFIFSFLLLQTFYAHPKPQTLNPMLPKSARGISVFYKPRPACQVYRKSQEKPIPLN